MGDGLAIFRRSVASQGASTWGAGRRPGRSASRSRSRSTCIGDRGKLSSHAVNIDGDAGELGGPRGQSLPSRVERRDVLGAASAVLLPAPAVDEASAWRVPAPWGRGTAHGGPTSSSISPRMALRLRHRRRRREFNVETASELKTACHVATPIGTWRSAVAGRRHGHRLAPDEDDFAMERGVILDERR